LSETLRIIKSEFDIRHWKLGETYILAALGDAAPALALGPRAACLVNGLARQHVVFLLCFICDTYFGQLVDGRQRQGMKIKNVAARLFFFSKKKRNGDFLDCVSACPTVNKQRVTVEKRAREEVDRMGDGPGRRG